MIDAIRLKEVVRSSIPRLAEALYPNGKFCYREWRVGNVAGDLGGSLGIRLVGSKKGLWIDRATGESGNIIDLVMVKFGCGFKEAVEWVERTLGVSFETSEQTEEAGEKSTGSGDRKATSKALPEVESIRQPLLEPEPVFVPLAPDQLKRMALAARRLAQAPQKIFEVLGDRPEISLDTVRGCALESDLGYEDDCRFYDLSGPAILFGYSYGIKARWAADANGKRLIRWIVGKPAKQCWRQSLLRSDHQSACIFEGETDALSALSAGVEEDDEHCLVVGLAGAQILPDPKPFAGKKIVVFPDPGEEGTRSSSKLQALLDPVAASVAIIEGGQAK
jgi:hypothetical protein